MGPPIDESRNPGKSVVSRFVRPLHIRLPFLADTGSLSGFISGLLGRNQLEAEEHTAASSYVVCNMRSSRFLERVSALYTRGGPKLREIVPAEFPHHISRLSASQPGTDLVAPASPGLSWSLFTKGPFRSGEGCDLQRYLFPHTDETLFCSVAGSREPSCPRPPAPPHTPYPVTGPGWNPAVVLQCMG